MHEHVGKSSHLRHRHVFRVPVVGFLNDEDTMTCFGEVLGTNTTAASASHDDNVRLDDLWAIAWRDLDEFVVVAVYGLVVDGCPWETQDFVERWTAGEPCPSKEKRE